MFAVTSSHENLEWPLKKLTSVSCIHRCTRIVYFMGEEADSLVERPLSWGKSVETAMGNFGEIKE